MTWCEISFNIPETLAERCSDQLERLGAVAVSFLDAGDKPLLEPLPGTTPLWDEVKVVGLFPEKTDVASLKTALTALFPKITLTAAPLAEQDWTRVCLEHFQPMPFGKRLWICPFDYPPLTEVENPVVVKLDPGLAFGTGTHPTTALCLEWLDAHPPLAQIVIDYGCGSGILGIAAARLGAEKVFAIDYDPQALLSTQDNALRNQVSGCIAVSTTLPTPIPLAQTILANILAQPLIELAPTLAQSCALGGHIVLSGLLTNQSESVTAAYAPWFDFSPMMVKEDWVLLCGTKIRA